MSTLYDRIKSSSGQREERGEVEGRRTRRRSKAGVERKRHGCRGKASGVEKKKVACYRVKN